MREVTLIIIFLATQAFVKVQACPWSAVPSVINKKKQGFTFSSYHQWEKDLRDEVKTELTRPWCEETRLFNHDFIQSLLDYTPHPNLRWHYFVAWMMLGVKQWIEVFDVEC